jgi:hypothetical protein
MRLECATFWVDVRVANLHGRGVASADTTDGPSLGLGWQPLEAWEKAPDPFDGVVPELLASLPDVLNWR